MTTDEMRDALLALAIKHGAAAERLAVCQTEHFGCGVNYKDFFLHVGKTTVYNVRSFDAALVEMDLNLAAHATIKHHVCPTCGNEVETAATVTP